MKKIHAIALAGAAAVAVGAFAIPAQSSPGPTDPPTTSSTPKAPTATASDALAKDLAAQREEARMARDLYQAFADKYGEGSAFARIEHAQQHHFDALGRQLNRYGLTDPSADKAVGSYADADLSAAYKRLLAQGQKSLNDAYDAGIAVEKAEVEELTAVMARTTETDAQRHLEQLRNGAERQLAALTALRNGETLEPGVLGRGMRGEGRPEDGQRGRESRGERGVHAQEGRGGHGARGGDGTGGERSCPRN